MSQKMSKTLALISGLVLMLTGMISFIPNPVIGQGALIGRFAPLPLIYSGLGIVLLLISVGGERAAASGLYATGAVSLLTSLAAYTKIDGSGTAPLTDGLRMAQSDIFFIAILGIMFVVFGKMNTARKQLMFD